MASQNLAPLFNSTIDKNLFLEFQDWDPGYRRVYHMSTTNRRTVLHQSWQGYSMPQQRYPGNVFAQGMIQPSFNKLYIIRRWGLGDSFAREDVEDDLTGILTKGLPSVGGGMARAFQNRMETDAMGFLATQGFASGTVVGMADGKSLFNTAHPISQSNTGSTWANRPSVDVDLSISSAQAAITNLRTQKAPDNITFMQNRPRCLLINPVNSFIAPQILKQKMERGTTDNNTNYISDYNIDIVEDPFWQVSGSTGTYNGWAMFGQEHYLNFILRQAYRTYSWFDGSTASYCTVVDAGWDEGASDARGTYASKGG